MVAMKRGILVIGCAVAFAAAPLVVASPAAADGCPWGTAPTRWEGVCAKSSAGGGPNAVVSPPKGPNIVNSPGGVGSVNGIPCTPEHYATCYGMIQNGA
jgi:hypothetical protein